MRDLKMPAISSNLVVLRSSILLSISALLSVDGRFPMSSARPLLRKQVVISSRVMWWIFSKPMISLVLLILIGNIPGVAVTQAMHRVLMMERTLP